MHYVKDISNILHNEAIVLLLLVNEDFASYFKTAEEPQKSNPNLDVI